MELIWIALATYISAPYNIMLQAAARKSKEMGEQLDWLTKVLCFMSSYLMIFVGFLFIKFVFWIFK